MSASPRLPLRLNSSGWTPAPLSPRPGRVTSSADAPVASASVRYQSSDCPTGTRTVMSRDSPGPTVASSVWNGPAQEYSPWLASSEVATPSGSATVSACWARSSRPVSVWSEPLVTETVTSSSSSSATRAADWEVTCAVTPDPGSAERASGFAQSRSEVVGASWASWAAAGETGDIRHAPSAALTARGTSLESGRGRRTRPPTAASDARPSPRRGPGRAAGRGPAGRACVHRRTPASPPDGSPAARPPR